jgi:hypothetical protein
MVKRFDLERFEWNAPDRLEVSGQFHGFQEPPGEPVLIVNSDSTPHRLEAAPDTVPADSGQWRAEFVWDGVPVGVDSAVLELGPEIVFDLPPPGKGTTQELDVRDADADADPAAPQPVGSDVAMQARLLAAEQETEELRAALERVESELARARSDVESERAGRAADAERFRDGLAQVQASAEQAIAAAREQSERDGEALRERAAAAEELQQRLSVVEDAGTEAGELRDDAERLLARLTRLVDALGAGK